jgi:hypothetical protein
MFAHYYTKPLDNESFYCCLWKKLRWFEISEQWKRFVGISPRPLEAAVLIACTGMINGWKPEPSWFFPGESDGRVLTV